MTKVDSYDGATWITLADGEAWEVVGDPKDPPDEATVILVIPGRAHELDRDDAIAVGRALLRHAGDAGDAGEEKVLADAASESSRACARETSVKPGDVVQMSAELKAGLVASGSAEHVREFGHCYGRVEDLVDYGDGQLGPEVNVRWVPSNLRYAYDPDRLVFVGRPHSMNA